MRHRGLLTDGDREFLCELAESGDEKLDEDDASKLRDFRWKFRQRVENLESDLAILADSGQQDLVDEFHDSTDRVSRVESEVAAIRQHLEDANVDS